MKGIFKYLLMAFILLIILPFSAFLSEGKNDTLGDSYDDISFRILDSATGKITTVSALEFTIGAIAAEVPSSYSMEALKAQAVASFTYALRQKLQNQASQPTELKGADFEINFQEFRRYITEEGAREKFSQDFETAYEKCKLAAQAVLGEVVLYDNQPIVAAYHEISSGKTEEAKNVWGGEVPYLISVDSTEDTSAPNFESKMRFSEAEFTEKLKTIRPELSFSLQELASLTLQRSEAGTVLSIQIGGQTFTGAEIRQALSLRSSNFTLSEETGEIVVAVKGSGHGVGMSQYGAEKMAQAGKSYRDILLHFYPNTELGTVGKQ